MAKKLPPIEFDTTDWLTDPALSRCTPAVRGIWMDLLCGMHNLDRCGQLSGTAKELAKIARCSTSELGRAMNELSITETAIVRRNGQVFTVCNRRMLASFERRKSLASKRNERRAVSREGPCRCSVADVVPKNSIKGTIGVSETLSLPVDEDVPVEEPITATTPVTPFDEFWNVFPRGRRKSKAIARKAYEKAREKTSDKVLLGAAIAYSKSDVGRSKFVQMPSSWLNQECWEDDPESWQDKDSVLPTAEDDKNWTP